jgi:ribosomal protein L20
MKRCDWCEGHFGLVVYRHWARRFCKRRCKDLYIARLQRLAQSSKTQWHSYLYGIKQAG